MSIDELVKQLKQLAITKDAKLREECETLQFVIKMAALNEREACAKVCESLEIPDPDTIEGANPDYVDGKRMAVMQCADAIRAKGNLIVLTPSKGE